MQDANTLTWAGPKARAEALALGHPERPSTWVAPVPANEAFAAELGPKSIAVHAEANHGRWIVACPDCGGAQLACPDDPRFMCNECANAVVGGFWRRVIWPKNRAKIEELLMVRPDPKNRNWVAGEPVANLVAENQLFGVGS